MRTFPLPARLATFGATLGCIVASGLMPDGCAIHEEDSLRLRVGVPIWFPVVLLALGLLLSRRRRLAAILALTVCAAAAIDLGVALIYRSSVDDAGGALVVLWAALAVVL